MSMEVRCFPAFSLRKSAGSSPAFTLRTIISEAGWSWAGMASGRANTSTSAILCRKSLPGCALRSIAGSRPWQIAGIWP